jgi:hypothetical protein
MAMASLDTQDDFQVASSKEGDEDVEEEEQNEGDKVEAIHEIDDNDDDNDHSSLDSSDEEADEEYHPPQEEQRKKRKAVGSARLSVTLGTNFDEKDVDSSESEYGPTDTTHLYKVLLDSSTDETKAIFDNWQPTVAFQWLACRFAKKVKRGFFTHSWDIVRIISEELGYTVTSFLEFRGWAFYRDKKDNSPCLRYHRFSDCVEHLEYEKKEALNLHFNSMLAGLFGIL